MLSPKKQKTDLKVLLRASREFGRIMMKKITPYEDKEQPPFWENGIKKSGNLEGESSS